MSKESFMRGFCKVAEAHGVDPVKIAKYAAENNVQQQYKTDGYTPKMREFSVPGFDLNIPIYYPANASYTTRDTAKSSIVKPIELTAHKAYNSPDALALRLANPRLGAWWSAHTNALSKATQPLRDAGVDPSSSASIQKDLQDAISKIYHDEMLRTTNSTPTQASVPVKK